MRKTHYRSEILAKSEFLGGQKQYLTRAQCLPQHLPLLLKAKKRWGIRPNSQFTFETFDYFESHRFPPTADVCGGHIDFASAIILERVEDCVITTHDVDPASEDQFTFQIHSDANMPIDLCLDSGFPLLCNQSELWQHFMQDTLHFLFFSNGFLLQNPTIPILLYGPIDANILKIIKGVFGLRNPLLRFPPIPSPVIRIKVDQLFHCRFLPDSNLYSCPPEMRRMINQSLSNNHVKKNKLVYLSRKSQATRRVTNEHALIDFLKDFANQNRLELIFWEPGKYTLSDMIEIMQTTAICLAPHGGANLHIYWMTPGTQFIEVVFPNALETFMSIACSIGLNYWMLPIENTDHFVSEFVVDIPALSLILNGGFCREHDDAVPIRTSP